MCITDNGGICHEIFNWVYMYMCIYINVYVYIYRERERESCVYMHII